jgi:hypothetical protein
MSLQLLLRESFVILAERRLEVTLLNDAGLPLC